MSNPSIETRLVVTVLMPIKSVGLPSSVIVDGVTVTLLTR